MTLRFVPPKQVSRYALYVDDGFFKTYNDVGFAKVALRHHNYRMLHSAKILEMVDGEWYTLYDIPAGTEWRDVPWYKETIRWDYYSRSDRKQKKAKPMTRDEYAEWRVAVERERTKFNPFQETQVR